MQEHKAPNHLHLPPPSSPYLVSSARHFRLYVNKFTYASLRKWATLYFLSELRVKACRPYFLTEISIIAIEDMEYRA